jgi:hypothetical protein
MPQDFGYIVVFGLIAAFIAAITLLDHRDSRRKALQATLAPRTGAAENDAGERGPTEIPHYAREGRKEIRNHAIIAMGLAMAAAALDAVREENPHGASIYLRILIILVVGLIVFLIVFLVELGFERRAHRIATEVARQRKMLPAVGYIDGLWIDAVWEWGGAAWVLQGGSIIEIRTNDQDGIKLEGNFYKTDTLATAARRRDGWFRGTGDVLQANGLLYSYEGGEIDRDGRVMVTHHDGVGYYRFTKDVISETVTFVGNFMADELRAARRAEGRKLSEAEARTSQLRKLDLLKEIVDHAETRAPLART